MIAKVDLENKIGNLLHILYEKRFAALEKLTLSELLKKNPYLYRALGENQPGELLMQLLLARISSSDETIFGNDFFEPLAIFAAQSAHPHQNVTVGAGAGQDISIETATEYFAISVKSGVNIFNSQSQKGQSAEFQALQARLKKVKKQFRAIIGYGYGRKIVRKITTEERLAGQEFWELLTSEGDFYLRISQAMEHFAGPHRLAFQLAFERKHTLLLKVFLENFISPMGDIDWDRLVSFNSSKNRPSKLRQAV